MNAEARRPPSVVIAAGGTGGHIYPGLALADALRRAEPGARISFVGTPRGLEQTLVVQAGWPLHTFNMVPFSGWQRPVAPAALVRSAAQARRILRDQQADVVVGMGGYASIPAILAARWARLPAIIHESGAVAGRANRISARFTRFVALAFDSGRGSFNANVHTRVVGMPISAELAAFDRAALRPSARERFGLDDNTFFLLLNGGSQGSSRLNEVAVGLARRWRHRDDVRLLVKAGRTATGGVQEAVAAEGGSGFVTVVDYIDHMPTAYAAADAAVTRGGAGTVAELATCGLPAVLVPYPYAPDDHQAVNAGVLVDSGAAVMIRDDQAGADTIGPVIEDLIDHRDKLAAMATAARDVAHPDAADQLAAWALELASSGVDDH